MDSINRVQRSTLGPLLAGDALAAADDAQLADGSHLQKSLGQSGDGMSHAVANSYCHARISFAGPQFRPGSSHCCACDQSGFATLKCPYLVVSWLCWLPCVSLV